MKEKVTSNPQRDEAYLQSVIQKQICLFESIKEKQISHLRSIGGEPIKITFPYGKIKEGKQ